MDVAISPYHLTTRESTALAGLLLGDRAVTVLPAPASSAQAAPTRELFDRAVRGFPAYQELLERWEWSAPLWRAGVLGSVRGDHGLGEDLAQVRAQLDTSPRWGLLRSVLRTDLRDPEAFFGALCRDLLRGGSEPAVSLLVAAAMDRFAARHGLVVMRPSQGSLAQQAEASMGQSVVSVAIPLLLQATGGALLRARELWEQPLNRLRRALEDVLHSDAAEGTHRELREAASLYAAAVREGWGAFVHEHDAEEIQSVEGTVVLELRRVDWDIALRAGQRALSSLGAREIAHRDGSELAPLSGVESPQVCCAFVKVMGARSGAWRSGAAARGERP